MILVLMVPGLDDNPLSFRPWEEVLFAKNIGNKVVETISMTYHKDWCFNDRVEVVENAIEKADNNPEVEEIYLIGQSAGGLAVLVAASVCRSRKIKKVIAVSPATPKGISPIGFPLLKVIWKYIIRMFLGVNFQISKGDYEYVALNGIPKTFIDEMFDKSSIIPAQEALDLSMFWRQPKLGHLNVPVLFVCGKEDNWVNPRSQKKFFEEVSGNNSSRTDFLEVDGMGHFPFHGLEGKRIAEKVINYMVH